MEKILVIDALNEENEIRNDDNIQHMIEKLKGFTEKKKAFIDLKNDDEFTYNTQQNQQENINTAEAMLQQKLNYKISITNLMKCVNEINNEMNQLKIEFGTFMEEIEKEDTRIVPEISTLIDTIESMKLAKATKEMNEKPDNKGRIHGVVYRGLHYRIVKFTYTIFINYRLNLWCN